MKCLDIEIAVAEHFNPRVNLIVPNVHWGFGIHECDLLIVSGRGYATEVEIKVSTGDLKNDMKKKHKHESSKVNYLYFAIPEQLLSYIEFIPKRAGIICIGSEKSVKYSSSYSSGKAIYPCRIHRPAERCGNYQMTLDERFAIARLGTMRIWRLKQKLASEYK